MLSSIELKQLSQPVEEGAINVYKKRFIGYVYNEYKIKGLSTCSNVEHFQPSKEDLKNDELLAAFVRSSMIFYNVSTDDPKKPQKKAISGMLSNYQKELGVEGHAQNVNNPYPYLFKQFKVSWNF